MFCGKIRVGTSIEVVPIPHLDIYLLWIVNYSVPPVALLKVLYESKFKFSIGTMLFFEKYSSKRNLRKLMKIEESKFENQIKI